MTSKHILNTTHTVIVNISYDSYIFLISGVVLFTRKHRRSPSHFNLKYGRENSPPDSPVKDVVHITSEIESKDGLEVSDGTFNTKNVHV